MASSAPTAEADVRDPVVDELRGAFRGLFRTLTRLRGRDTHLVGGEISQAQFELLCELQDRGELPAGELAAAAGLTPATVTQMLEHLAESGDVDRARSETDRRVVVSRLTPQGRSKIQAKRELWQRRWDEALEGIPVRDLEAATMVFDRLRAMVESAPAPAPAQVDSGSPQSTVQPAHR